MTSDKKRIMIVEDNDQIAKLLRTGLEENTKYELFFATEGNQAVKKIQEVLPDLVILDIVVPGLNGYQICKRVKENPRTAYIPVLMLSGTRIDTDDKVHGLEAGGDDYLIKPFDIDELKARIHALLRRSESFLDANSLTKLPGSNRIHQEIEKRVRSRTQFAVAYCDLSNFKAFNDVYGYERGNRVIEFTSVLLLNALKAHDEHGFLGHVGGDDFLFICSIPTLEKIATRAIEEFDSGILLHYDIEDLKKGGIRTENRQGQLERFKVM
ncbi:MAG TPA: response regulator, partial [Acidobacteriota bacterium]|nr:response regulator [Acidobacteriota bacterium]